MSLFSNGQIQLGWMGFIKVLSIILLVVIIIILKIKRNKPFHVFIVRGKMKNSVKTVRVYFKINLFFCVVYPNFISTQKCVSGRSATCPLLWTSHSIENVLQPDIYLDMGRAKGSQIWWKCLIIHNWNPLISPLPKQRWRLVEQGPNYF